MDRVINRPASWLPQEYGPADVRAIQDLEQGKADEDQQKRALALIINTICATYHPSYRESQRDTDFMEGRRFVGLELVNLLKLSASKVAERRK